VLARESDIKLSQLKVFTFPCPASWRPETAGMDRNEDISSLSPYVYLTFRLRNRLSNLPRDFPLIALRGIRKLDYSVIGMANSGSTSPADLCQ